jgi:leader peptidase (prepilin peptidase)/N-methyltransferase
MEIADIPRIALVALSPFIGSFLAVLADRLPRGEDVVRAPSACRACKRRLQPRDLIPVLSFSLSAGRCAGCGAPIPPWLLYMEIMATGLAVVALIIGGSAGEAWLIALFLWLLLALTASDLLWFRLPDLLTGALFLTALGMALILGWPPPALALTGAILGSGVFMALRWGYHALRGREGLGLGDVKLMAGLGAALGPYDLPLMLLLAALTALAVAAVGRLRSARALSPTRPLPFGAALCAATGLIWLLLRLPV